MLHAMCSAALVLVSLQFAAGVRLKTLKKDEVITVGKYKVDLKDKNFLGAGTFAKVYKTTAEDGEPLAIKLFIDKCRLDEDYPDEDDPDEDDPDEDDPDEDEPWWVTFEQAADDNEYGDCSKSIDTLKAANQECTMSQEIHKLTASAEHTTRSLFIECTDNGVKSQNSEPSFVAFKYLGTTDLQKYKDMLIKEHRTFKTEDLIRIGTDLLKGVALIGSTYVHRDIKPANVMVEETITGGLSVTIIDLGFMVKNGSTVKLAGTTTTMPPEAFEPRYITTTKFDTYSIGATLAALICGRSVFESIYEALSKTKSGDLSAQTRSELTNNTWDTKVHCPNLSPENKHMFKVIRQKMLCPVEDRATASELLARGNPFEKEKTLLEKLGW